MERVRERAGCQRWGFGRSFVLSGQSSFSTVVGDGCVACLSAESFVCLSRARFAPPSFPIGETPECEFCIMFL